MFDMNQFLGPRWKLYIYVTGIAIDPSRRFFEQDVKNMQVDNERFQKVMQPVIEIDSLLRLRGATVTVFLNPYERQLRDGSNGNYEPQDRSSAFLGSNGIRVIETRAKFYGLGRSADAFLLADPMHLSGTGHALVYKALQEDWESQSVKPLK